MSSSELPTLRAANARAARARFLDAALAVLEAGEDCTMRSVAAAAKVSERTIYRYFENHDTLVAAVRAHVRPLIGTQLPGSVDELESYAQALFEKFDAKAELLVSLTALAARSMRDEFRETRSANLENLQALFDRAFPEAPIGERRAAVASLRVPLSGAGWVYLRVSCGLSNDEVIRSSQWAIRRSVERLASFAGEAARVDGSS